MSHSKERKEKNCLNCSAEINGRYCSICGQENTEPQESVWDLFTHFFNDITHFDGKFFSSVKYLFTKPGFLSAEYVSGRRASYLNPVRMYVFTSAIFFLIYFSFFSQKNLITFDRAGTKSISIGSIKNKSSNSSSDSAKAGEYGNKYAPVKKTTLLFGDSSYHSKNEYDSLRKAGIAKEGFLKRLFIYKGFSLQEKYGNDSTRFIENLVEAAKHRLPQTFFFSLPLLALFLTFLYKRRKQFYYAAHIIFAIHIYVFVYIARIITESLKLLGTATQMNWLRYAELLFFFIVLYYLYRAMKNFYKQGAWKTLVKFICLFIWFSLVLALLMIIILTFTLYKL